MNNVIRFAAVAVLLTGTFAAASYPTNPKSTTILGDGSAPMPLCAPGDPSCDPGPYWPKPGPSKPTQPTMTRR